MEDDSNKKYENSKYLYYNPDEPFYGSVLKGFPSSIEDKEYEYAMESYIATPDSKSSYVFNLDSLRAAERKWPGGIIALRKDPQTNDTEAIPLVELQYRIISDNTSGDIEGRLVYKGEVR